MFTGSTLPCANAGKDTAPGTATAASAPMNSRRDATCFITLPSTSKSIHPGPAEVHRTVDHHAIQCGTDAEQVAGAP